MARRLRPSVLAIWVCVACGPMASEAREFAVHIDSVTAPAAVSGDAAFQLQFYGPVGPNGCYRFKSFRVTRTSADADVTTVGERVGGTCVQMPVYLSAEPLTIAPPVSAPFTVRIHQPDGTILTRVIPAD